MKTMTALGAWIRHANLWVIGLQIAAAEYRMQRIDADMAHGVGLDMAELFARKAAVLREIQALRDEANENVRVLA